MKEKLLNHQQKPRPFGMKTRRLDTVTKILMVLFTMTLFPQGTWAQVIQYKKYSKDQGKFISAECASGDYTYVSASDATWGTSGQTKYYAAVSTSTSEISLSNRITVVGDVHLILGNSMTLKATKGITVSTGSKLTIYAQGEGTTEGKLEATGLCTIQNPGGWNPHSDNLYGAPIGAYYNGSAGTTGCGEIYIHGGQITANANEAVYSAGIGGCGGSSNKVEIYGGKITARGGTFGAGIGGGAGENVGDGGEVNIYGGTVIAYGGNGAGIGGGANGGSGGSGGTVTINGGSVTAIGKDGAGIGGGAYGGSGGTVTINGGTVMAYGGTDTCNDGFGAGIGGGSKGGNGANVTINGGTVSAHGGTGYPDPNYAEGIGRGGNPEGSPTSGTLTLGKGIVCYGDNDNTSPTGLNTQTTVTTRYRYMKTGIEDYSLWVEGTLVTSANADDVPTSSTAGKVSYDNSTGTLTLDGVTLTGAIVTYSGNLNIHIKNNCSISSPANCIRTGTYAGTLTFTKEGNGKLELNSTNHKSVIKGFPFLAGVPIETKEPYQLCTTDDYHMEKLLVYENDTTGIDYAIIDDNTTYPLWVNSKQVTSKNSSNVLNSTDATPPVVFKSGTNTLELNKAVFTGKIVSSLGNLILNVSGSNKITSPDTSTIVRSVNAGTLTIVKNTDDAALELLVNGYGDNPVIQGFHSLVYTGFDMNTPASSPKYDIFSIGTPNGNRNIYGLFDPDATYNAAIKSATFATNYDLWVSYRRVTSANASDIWGTGTDFSFDPASSTLYYRSGGSTSYPIHSGLPNLTIKIGSPDGTGSYDKNNISFMKFGSPNGESIAATSGNLIISKEDNVTGPQQFYLVPSGEPGIQGFANVTYSDFVILEDGAYYDTNDKKIKDGSNNVLSGGLFTTQDGITAPTMSRVDLTDGSFLALSNNLSVGTLKYDVNYADGTSETNKTYDDSNRPKFNKAGTVEAYVTINGVNSDPVIGKYFAYDNEVSVVYSGSDKAVTPPSSPVPAIASTDGVGLTYSVNAPYTSVQSGATANSLTAKGVGSSLVEVLFTPSTSTPYTILNPISSAEFWVRVVPGAPTITHDGTKQYVTTDKLEMSSVAGSDILYTWDDSPSVTMTLGTKISSDLTNTNLQLYDSTNKPNVQKGTVKAWAVYYEDSGYWIGEEHTQNFNAKIDISSYVVEDIGNLVYTGSELTPTIKVKASNTATTYLDGTKDYTVKYQVKGADKSPVNADTYDVIITGMGDYTGTNSTKTFTIDQVDLSTSTDITVEAVPDQTYTGSAITPTPTVKFKGNDLVAGAGNDFVYGYLNNVDLASSTDPTAPPTVTITGNGNFKNTTSVKFTIKEQEATVDFGTRKYITYYNSSTGNLLVPDNVKAYTVTGVSGNELVVEQKSFIAPNTIVLLEKSSGWKNVKDPSDSFTINLLKHATSPVDATGKKYYVLYNNEFVRATGTIPIGKNYLDLSTVVTPARTLIIGGNNSATAIEAVSEEAADGEEKWYDMQGRQINKPTKAGLYIKNGKKVVVNIK